MEYQQSDSYVRDLQTGIVRDRQSLTARYDSLISAYQEQSGDTLTVEHVRWLAEAADFLGADTDRADDAAQVLDEYVGDTRLTWRHASPTSWSELAEYLTYAELIADTERREAVAKRGGRRALQYMVPY